MLLSYHGFVFAKPPHHFLLHNFALAMEEKTNDSTEPVDPIVAYAQKVGGNIQIYNRSRDGGITYVYYWYENGVQKRKTFSDKLRREDIKAEILRLQENARYIKAGMMNYLAERRRKQSRTTIMELAAWYIEISMIEKVPAKHEYRDYKIESIKTTMAGYEYAAGKMREFFLDVEGHDKVYVENLTREHVNRFKRWMIQRNKLSARLANNVLRRLNVIFKKARYEVKLDANPFSEIEYIKEHKSESKRAILTLQEMKMIAESEYVVEHPQLWLAWQIMRFTGMRGADLFRMKRKWIDLKDETYTVYVAKRGGQLIERPFHRNLAKYLKMYFAEYQLNDDDLLISENKNNFSQKFNYSIRRILTGVKNIGTHTPRHSISSYLRNQAGWDHDWIGYFLLHTAKDITGIYTHEHMDKLREKINALALDGGEVTN